MSIRIASFNVKNLSLGPGRDLDRIASIINDNAIDIVAMQEVLSEGKVLTGIGINSASGQARAYEYSLKRRLRGNWRICWCDPKTHAKNYPYLGEDSRGEGYAFLWNADKFDLPLDEKGQEILPRIWRNYKATRNSELVRLIRDPCVGRFKVKNLKVEIRLITTHIVFGKPTPDRFAKDIDYGATGLRLNEFKTLAGDIYPRVSDYCKDIHCSAAYTIMLGDYNLNLQSSGIGKSIVPDIVWFDSQGNMMGFPEGADRTIITEQAAPTTLKLGEPGYANNYDHFSYDLDTKNKIVRSISLIDAVHQNEKAGDQTEEDKFDTYRKEVSDHVPIVLEIDFR